MRTFPIEQEKKTGIEKCPFSPKLFIRTPASSKITVDSCPSTVERLDSMQCFVLQKAEKFNSNWLWKGGTKIMKQNNSNKT